jgi:hypothetical protein
MTKESRRFLDTQAPKKPDEQVMNDISLAMRRHFLAEDKICIVLDCLCHPRSHRKIGDGGALAPLLDGCRSDPVAFGQRPFTLFTPLYCWTDRLCYAGAPV